MLNLQRRVETEPAQLSASRARAEKGEAFAALAEVAFARFQMQDIALSATRNGDASTFGIDSDLRTKAGDGAKAARAAVQAKPVGDRMTGPERVVGKARFGGA